MCIRDSRVGALFLVKGKILPGGFDINTGTVTFDPNPNPVDDGYIDPAAPDITDAVSYTHLSPARCDVHRPPACRPNRACCAAPRRGCALSLIHI